MTAPRFITNSCWSRVKPKTFSADDYVVATKYVDGDAGDHFCVGLYAGTYDHYGELRHLVVDMDGNHFRRNGFRRAEHVSVRRGSWMVKNFALIERMRNRYSVWHWHRAPWSELHKYEGVADG